MGLMNEASVARSRDENDSALLMVSTVAWLPEWMRTERLVYFEPQRKPLRLRNRACAWRRNGEGRAENLASLSVIV